MKISIAWQMMGAVMASLGVWTFIGCSVAARRTAHTEKLPLSCTLPEMSPEERLAHQKRLSALGKASESCRETSEGFEFTVDLQHMPEHDLQLWVENEQRCCSFLKIRSKIIEAGRRAHVSVECPSKMRTQMMEVFGMQSSDKAPDGSSKPGS